MRQRGGGPVPTRTQFQFNPRALLSGSLPPRPPKPCTSDTDCNHAGTCADGKCTCDAPFYGNSCEKFTLYSYKPDEGGLEIPTGNTTWGGSVVEADGNYPFLLCPPPLLAGAVGPHTRWLCSEGLFESG